VWLLNHPTIFVATTLVGNNLANYLTSFAIVWAAATLFDTAGAELIGPMLMTPLVFVLGELLPKYLFFHAPYRLLKATRPFLLAATVVLAPISLLLGLLGSLLQVVTGQTPLSLRLAMARRELDQVLRDGHEAGLLAAGQRALAQNLFDVGNQPAISFGVPLSRLAVVNQPIDPAQARRKALRQNHPIVLIKDQQRIVGFLRYAELCVDDKPLQPRPVIQSSTSARHLEVLLRLYDAASDVAVLCDDSGDVRSVVTRRQLLQSMLK
jgi:CBS domain containing-hemolysin-like protein